MVLLTAQSVYIIVKANICTITSLITAPSGTSTPFVYSPRTPLAEHDVHPFDCFANAQDSSEWLPLPPSNGLRQTLALQCNVSNLTAAHGLSCCASGHLLASVSKLCPNNNGASSIWNVGFYYTNV